MGRGRGVWAPLEPAPPGAAPPRHHPPSSNSRFRDPSPFSPPHRRGGRGGIFLSLAAPPVPRRRALGRSRGLGTEAGVARGPLLSRLNAGGAEAGDAADASPAPGWGIRDGRGFGALCAIGMIDNATRTGFLTFMPFILMAKGLGVGGVGLAFALVFAGGATGKFVCGVVADRVGVIRTVVITEAATTVLILTVVAAPLPVALAVLIPLGIALNGTSSVLYGTVADLVSSERRSRAYGLYYTTTI